MGIYRSLLFFAAIAMFFAVERYWSSTQGSENSLDTAATTQRAYRIQSVALFSVACLAMATGLTFRKLEKKVATLGDTVAALRDTVATLEQQLSSGRVIRRLGDRIAALEEELPERIRE